MTKPISRPYSMYNLNALRLLGQFVREARITKALTTSDLAARAGISRALLARIERGDPGCSIGAMFEVATICGIPLFEQDQKRLSNHVAIQREKMALLPKSVRVNNRNVRDDF